MFQLIYVSADARTFSEAELLELLASARERNRAQEITGLLVYHRGCFLQVFEGPKQTVLNLYERISADKRHEGVKLVWLGGIKKRMFGSWSMGFTDTSQLPKGVEEFVDLNTAFNELDRVGATQILSWFKNDLDQSSVRNALLTEGSVL